MRLAQTNFFSRFVIVCYDPRQWRRANRTNENLNIGKNCQMAGDDTFANSQVVLAAALATSKTWIQMNAQFDLRRKSTIKLVAS